MNRILVATDFSPRSDRALRRATLIARQSGATLTLVHVIDGDQPERMIATGRAEASALLNEAANTVRDMDGITAQAVIKIDDVYSGILDAAEAVDADLIVIGPHRGRLIDVFTGTAAERVVRRTRRPLLVASQPPSAPYARAMLALDFDEASRSAGRAALALGIFDRMPVVVMHAFDVPGDGALRRGGVEQAVVKDHRDTARRDSAAKLEALVTEIGLPPVQRRLVSVIGTPARSICETALEENADLVVMGANQRKGFERLLIGSVTETMIREARRDILVIPVEE